MDLHRRAWLQALGLGLISGRLGFAEPSRAPLKIVGLKVTPIALPDPPILAASGCHGPYFLRNIVELETDAGILGLGETTGGEDVTTALERAKSLVIGRNAFAFRAFAAELLNLGPATYAAVELACLDACGKATGRRLCELVGGPVRDPVEFAAYMFYRYAADHPIVLADERLVDSRGRGANALDTWGEVRSPAAMAELAARFRDRFGFRVFKLKAGVLPPDVELETLNAMAARLGPGNTLRIDPNARWRTETAIRIGKKLTGLPLEYYEDPVEGRQAMAEVRRETGLKMSTNMCVTRFEHIPDALRIKPIDFLLVDLHYFGGFAGCQAVGPISEAAGWVLSQHSNSHAGITMAAMIHLAASIPRLTCASDTHYPWLTESSEIIHGGKLAIRAGRMAVPEGPGLGVELDRDRIAQAHETYKKCGMRRRNDAILMRRLDPGWERRPF